VNLRAARLRAAASGVQITTTDYEKGHGRRRRGGDAGRACTPRLREASVELDREILIEEIRTEHQDTSWTAGGK